MKVKVFTYLTVTVWSIIAETYKLLNKPIPDIRELTRLVENNPKVWELYEKGLTATLNQAGTDSGTPQAVQYKPKSVRELSAWVAAIRPSFKSMKEVFLNRKPFSYGIPEFDDILKESDNFVLYQENIMSVLVYVGFPEDETYGLLKAISKKVPGIIEPIYERFINGFVEKTGSKENGEKVWKIIEDAVGYGFNSSHALSVALDSIYGAYLKAEYPLEYYTVVLNMYENDTKMTAKIMKELDYFGLSVSSVKYGKSKDHYMPDHKTNTIYKGLQSVKYLNSKIANELYELSQFDSYDNFLDLYIDIIEKTSVNSKQLNILIRLNFFSEFGKAGHLLEIVEVASNGKNRYSKTHKEATKEKRKTLLKEEVTGILSRKPNRIELYDQVLFEKNILGYSTIKKPRTRESYHIVLEVDTKYTPRITFYHIKTGQEVTMKMYKAKFFQKTADGSKIPQMKEGDIIDILETEKRFKNKLVDGEWQPTEEQETYLIQCKKYVKK